MKKNMAASAGHRHRWVFRLRPRKEKVCILETEKGTLAFEMYPEVAPRTVARISELIAGGFFNGIVFHRVVADFVVQAGDPTGTRRRRFGPDHSRRIFAPPLYPRQRGHGPQ